MKKTVKIISAICAIVMLIGLLPIMSVSAEDPAAEATLVVTPSAETVKAGREFKITFSVENNTGLGAIAFDMPINTAAFEFVSATHKGMIFPNIGFCEMDSSGTIFKFNAAGTGRSNITDNGFLAEVTLKAKKDITLGNYTFAAEIDQKNTVKVAGVDPDLYAEPATVETASTSINVVPNVAVSTINSASVALGTDISVNYYVTLDEDHAGAQMRFTFNGEETVVNGVAVGNENEYVYSFTGIAPQCMGDNLKAELIFDGTVVATKDEYSVLANCQNLLASNAAALGLTDGQFAAMKTLIADLLVYGAKAQAYQNYKTGAPVDAGVTGATEFVAPGTSVRKVWDPTEVVDGVKFNSMGVFFDYTNSMYVKFTAVDMDDETLRVKLTNKETSEKVYYKLSDCELIDEATSTYFLKFDSVSVLDYNTSYEFDLEWYDSEDEEDWVRAHRIRYSVNAYVSAMCDNENTAMADLAKALYNYGVSAAAYLKA